MSKLKGTQDRPYWSALVVDGEAIKLRLFADRQFYQTPVHVDWVRFTVLRRKSHTPSADVLFTPSKPLSSDFTLTEYRVKEAEWLKKSTEKRMPLDEFAQEEFCAAAEALTLATEVAAAMGPAFGVFPEPKKGQDFYKYRWSIELNGAECGWVGFLSSSSSPNQSAQAKSLHVNLFGMACTFGENGWRERIADLCDDLEGNMTRVDLALDFFDGYIGGIEAINQDYKDGLCNVGGRKLKCNLVGDWNNGHDRSLYIGSRDAGKITNVYEKGDQLYGHEFGSDWLRVELRYGNQVRVLCSDMLRRPADFFAGASDWHASMLLKADAIVKPEPVARNPRLEIESVKAECSRSVRWLKQTAAASMALAFEFLGETEFLALVTNQKLPGRLSKFSRSDIQDQMKPAFELNKYLSLIKCPGTVATFSVDSCPAIA